MNFIDVIREMSTESIEILSACLGLICGFIWFTVRPALVDDARRLFYRIRRAFRKEKRFSDYTLYLGTAYESKFTPKEK